MVIQCLIIVTYSPGGFGMNVAEADTSLAYIHTLRQ